jgi:hypothetical protein
MRFQLSPDTVGQSEAVRGKIERVITRRVDARELRGHRSGVEIDGTASPAADSKESVRAGSVLEVFSNTERLRVFNRAKAATRGLQPKRREPARYRGGFRRC